MLLPIMLINQGEDFLLNNVTRNTINVLSLKMRNIIIKYSRNNKFNIKEFSTVDILIWKGLIKIII